MKKLLAILLATAMLLCLVACAETKNETRTEESVTETGAGEATGNEKTVGQTLLDAFRADHDGTAQEIAEALLQNEVIQFMGGAMPVEEGLLTGFENTEIQGFREGVMFAPMIGTIPFVGYIFEVSEGIDVELFKKTLSDSANLRWNICVSADEKIVENEGNMVFFLMCPESFEQSEEETPDMGLGMDDELLDVPAADGEMLDTPAVGGEEIA